MRKRKLLGVLLAAGLLAAQTVSVCAAPSPTADITVTGDSQGQFELTQYEGEGLEKLREELPEAADLIEQINAGRTDEEIIKYMVDRYGDFVLYNPPFKASTVILWVGPAVLFFGAVIAFYINLRRRKSQVAKTERALTPDEKRRAEALLRGDK